MKTILLATVRGVVRARRDGVDWRPVDRALEGSELTSILASDGAFLVGGRDGVFRSCDGAGWEPWAEGLTIPYVRWFGAGAGQVFAGTEPAGIFAVNGGAWAGRPEVERLRDRFKWFLPYSPEAGCVRGFAFHGNRGYAAVEVGGVLRTDDGGSTWRLAGGSSGEPVFGSPPAHSVHPDVHSIGGHPSSRDRVAAATGGGFYQSSDGGDTWTMSHEGPYCRAFWIDPGNPEHIILGPAEGVNRNGRIEESRNGGETWQMRSEGLDLPWTRCMVERFVQIGDELFAITSDQRLFSALLDELVWRRVLPEVKGIRAVTVA